MDRVLRRMQIVQGGAHIYVVHQHLYMRGGHRKCGLQRAMGAAAARMLNDRNLGDIGALAPGASATGSMARQAPSRRSVNLPPNDHTLIISS